MLLTEQTAWCFCTPVLEGKGSGWTGRPEECWRTRWRSWSSRSPPPRTPSHSGASAWSRGWYSSDPTAGAPTACGQPPDCPGSPWYVLVVNYSGDIQSVLSLCNLQNPCFNVVGTDCHHAKNPDNCLLNAHNYNWATYPNFYISSLLTCLKFSTSLPGYLYEYIVFLLAGLLINIWLLFLWTWRFRRFHLPAPWPCPHSAPARLLACPSSGHRNPRI